MRVSKQKSAEHRQQIVQAAANLFKQHGIGATGVDSITREAGLTHGAVYSQFGSKEAIAAEAMRLALRDSKQRWLKFASKKGHKKALPAMVAAYLSARHRDSPAHGCVVAALGGEIARQPHAVRDSFTGEFVRAADFLAELISSDDSSITRDDALALFASMAGAMMLARAVSDPALSDRILKVTSAWINGKSKSARA